MKWLKDVVIDVVVTVCIALATIQSVEWAKWVVWIYTPFILLLKIGSYFGPTVVKRTGKKTKASTPDWVYHLLYCANVVLLAVAGWWLEMAGWVAVWLVSYLAHRKS